MVKPSEAAPHVSQLIANLLPRYLDPHAYQVVSGAVQEVTKLLEFQWDHIFYTGNARVARIVASAAAKHLTPLTLELGGKSPVIVDSTYDMDLAAKRILWGKCNNAGQVRCVVCRFFRGLSFDGILDLRRTRLHSRAIHETRRTRSEFREGIQVILSRWRTRLPTLWKHRERISLRPSELSTRSYQW